MYIHIKYTYMYIWWCTRARMGRICTNSILYKINIIYIYTYIIYIYTYIIYIYICIYSDAHMYTWTGAARIQKDADGQTNYWLTIGQQFPPQKHPTTSCTHMGISGFFYFPLNLYVCQNNSGVSYMHKLIFAFMSWYLYERFF